MSVFVITNMALLVATFTLGLTTVVMAVKLRAAQGKCRVLKEKIIRVRAECGYYRMATEHSKDGVLIQNMDATVVWANPAYCRMMGRDLGDLIGRNPLEFALPLADRPPHSAIRSFRYNPNDPEFSRLELVRNQRADGTLFWNQISFSFLVDDQGRDQAIIVCRDVTEQIEQEEKLRETRNRLAHDAAHDPLTGLANRAELIRFATQELDRAKAAGDNVGILHVDLDRFKDVNDTHGHAAGDAVICHAARQLCDHIRRGDLVARVGGDEFVVICPGITCLDDLRTVALKLSRELSVALDWNDRVLSARGSIGAALSVAQTDNVDDLLSRSDFALYEAKRKGRGGVELYDDTLASRHTNQAARATALAQAVQQDALTHYFQPKMNLRSGQISGFETLVRWDHPTDGLIPPFDFLPMAEDLGIMAELDLCSMSGALRMKRELTCTGHPDLTISFNASPDLLSHPDFVNRLVWEVESGGLRRDQIIVEVLETTVFDAPTGTPSKAEIIHKLRSAGFQVMLDDFGIGYAGLSHLAQLDITGVKVDQSLVRNILTDASSAKIVGTIIELCSNLGLTTVAEGVETREVATRLKRLGCDYVQGYWLSKPMPQTDLELWMQSRDRLVA